MPELCDYLIFQLIEYHTQGRKDGVPSLPGGLTSPNTKTKRIDLALGFFGGLIPSFYSYRHQLTYKLGEISPPQTNFVQVSLPH